MRWTAIISHVGRNRALSVPQYRKLPGINSRLTEKAPAPVSIWQNTPVGCTLFETAKLNGVDP